MNQKLKISMVVLGLLVVAQLIPLPGRNMAATEPQNDLLSVLPANEATAQVIRSACYDCHSYESTYPWYAKVAPLSWWIQFHVNHGREHANFSTFGTLSMKKRDHLLEECVEMLRENEMPLSSYVWMHPEARLTFDQRTLLINFFGGHRATPETDE